MTKKEAELLCSHTGLKALVPPSELSGFNKCKYVIGDPKKHWAMCGRPIEKHSSWCKDHMKVVFMDSKTPKTNSFVKGMKR